MRPSPRRAGDERVGPLRELAHRNSIYTYMLYVPPISRTRHGHYCTSAVLVAMMLLVVNVVLQVSLTIIAGSYIFEQQSHFLSTLIETTPGSNYAPSLVHEVLREALDPTTWIPRIWDKIGNLGAELPKLEGCCIGADCAASGSPCCPPNGTPMATPALFATRFGAKRRQPSNNTFDRALCSFTNAGLLNCAPTTFGFLDRWPELDGDGDGVWASTESAADAANLGCQMGIPVDEVFRHASYGVQRDAGHSVLVGRGSLDLERETLGPTTSNMTRAQFEWWRGLVTICASTDPARCGELVRRGVFDGAMDPKVNTGGPGFRRGGVVDLETAVEYCQWMLRPSGLCDMALPGTYMMYRSRVSEKCGKPAISAGERHANPHNPRDVMVVMDVSYKNVRTHELIHGRPFKFFLTLILLMWFVSLVDELKDIVDLLDFIRNFPVDVQDAAAALPSVGQVISTMSQASMNVSDGLRHMMESAHGTGEETDDSFDAEATAGEAKGDKPLIVIESISRPHYFVCIWIAVVRLWVLMYMGNVGTGFVLSTHSFKDLLLNALALAFIFELPEFLFKFLVSERTKQVMDGVAKLKFRSSLPTSKLGRLLVTKHFWGLFFIPLLSIAIVWNNDTHRTVPVLEALRCTCAQSGDRCLVAQKFGKEWWGEHWREAARLAEADAAALRTVDSHTSPAAASSSLLQLAVDRRQTMCE